MLSREEQACLAEIARHLERDDPRLVTTFRRGGRYGSAVVPVAVVMVVLGTACFVLALTVPSAALFVLALIVIIPGWTALILHATP